MDIYRSEKRGTMLAPTSKDELSKLVGKLPPEVGELLHIAETIPIEGMSVIVNPNTLRYLGRVRTPPQKRSIFRKERPRPVAVRFVFRPAQARNGEQLIFAEFTEEEAVRLVRTHDAGAISWLLRGKLTDRLGGLCAQANMNAMYLHRMAEECQRMMKHIQKERYWVILNRSPLAQGVALELEWIDLERDLALFSRTTPRGCWHYTVRGNGKVTRKFLDNRFPF